MSSIELTELWYKYVQSEENGFESFKRYCGVLFSLPDHKSILYQPFKNTDFSSAGPCLDQLPKDCVSVATDRLARLEMRLLQDEMLDYALLLAKYLVLLARHSYNKEAVNNRQTKLVVFALIEAAFSKLAAGQMEMHICNAWIELLDYLFYFLEHVYDPNFAWRNRRLTMYGGSQSAASCQPAQQHSAVPNLTSEIIPWFYETFTAYDKTVPKEIRDRLLSLFCSFVCGSQNNALYLITPATLEALWKISDQSQWFVIALTCILEILGALPKYQRQVELESVVPNYVKLITAKPSLSVTELYCLEYLAKFSEELFVCLIKNGIVSALCNTLLARPSDSAEQVFSILSSISCSEGAIAAQFVASNCHALVSDCLCDAPRLPDTALERLFRWALGEPWDAERIHRVKDGRVIGVLVDLACRRWRLPRATKADADADADTVDNNNVDPTDCDCLLLADRLLALLRCTRHNVSECSACDVLSRVVLGLRLVSEAVEDQAKSDDDKGAAVAAAAALQQRLFELLTLLASHSMSSQQLLDLLAFFQEPRLYPCAREAMQCLADVARGQDLDRRPTRWFEIGGRGRDDFIMLPPDRIRLNAGCFAFHCWLCLYSLSTEETVGQFIRRQLYRFLTTSGNGFEAFVTQQQALGVACCANGEYNYILLPSFSQYVDNRWHMLDIVHAKGKGLLGRSSLTVYVDGRQLHHCEMRYPQLSDPCKLAHIGNGTRTAEDSIGVASRTQRSTSFGRSLLASLSPSSRSSSSSGTHDSAAHGISVSTVPLGGQDAAWGAPSSLSGQLALCEALAEALTAATVAELYRRGPEFALSSASVASQPYPLLEALGTSQSQLALASPQLTSASSAMIASAAGSSLAFGSSTTSAAAAAFSSGSAAEPSVPVSRVILCLHARACRGDECLDVTGQGLAVGGVTARVTVACPLAATVHQLGGPSVLLPMLERVELYETCRRLLLMVAAAAAGVGRDPAGLPAPLTPGSSTTAKAATQHAAEAYIDDDDEESGFVVLPDRPQDLPMQEQSSLAAFLALFRVLLETSAWNQLQALRSQLLPIASALARRVPARLVDSFFLRELELLCESPRLDEELRDRVCQHLLMDFRLWSAASHSVRTSHIQLVTKLAHTRRRYFRAKYGVRYILDAIRLHCMPGNPVDPFSGDDSAELRQGLFTIVRIYIGPGPSFDELHQVFKFLYTIGSDVLVSETLQMLTDLIEHSTRSSQLVLLIYEKPLAPSLYHMIASGDVSVACKETIFKFLLYLIRSDKMDAKYKAPLWLQGVGFAGLLTAWQPDVTHDLDTVAACVLDVLESSPTAPGGLVDRTGFMELLTYLPGARLPLKLRAVRALLNLLVSAPDAAESLASSEHGWQKLVAKLWIAAPLGQASMAETVGNGEGGEEEGEGEEDQLLLRLASSETMQQISQLETGEGEDEEEEDGGASTPTMATATGSDTATATIDHALMRLASSTSTATCGDGEGESESETTGRVGAALPRQVSASFAGIGGNGDGGGERATILLSSSGGAELCRRVSPAK